MKKITIKISLLWSVLLIAGCDFINPAEPIPAYIYVEDIKLETFGTEGSESENILDAWIFVNQNLIGIKDLPALLPVLADGTSRVDVRGGIAENGIREFRAFYPFYTTYIESRELKPGKIDTIIPVVNYKSDVSFVLMEDFEQSSNILGEDLDGDFDTRVNITNDEPFEGNAGIIELNQDHPLIEVSTSQRFELPNLVGEVFLEMDYKTDVNLSIGIRSIGNGTATSRYKVTLTASDEWKKIYIGFQEEVAAINANEYEIVFLAKHDVSLNTSTVLLDNIKVLHR